MCRQLTAPLSLLLAALVTVLAPRALAQQADAAKLGHEAKQLLARGKLDEACDRLADSHRVSPKITTLLELGQCRERQGKHAVAYRVYEQAAALSLVEKQPLGEKAARSKQQKLERSLAFVTIRAPQQPELRVDGEPLDAAWLGKAFALDPGEHLVEASAPGKKGWRRTLSLKLAERAELEVPALESDAPIAAATPVPAQSTRASEDNLSRSRADEARARSPRLVLELGAVGGMLYSKVDHTPTSLLDASAYSVPTAGGNVIVAACGDVDTVAGAGDCEGAFEPAFGGLVGGALFVAAAVHARVHLGARAIGAGRMPAGLLVAGGPAVSFRAVGPLWLGVAGYLGFQEHEALLLGARGSVPTEHQAAAGGSEVDVPLEGISDRRARIGSALIGGASLEIAVALMGSSAPALLRFDAPRSLLRGSLLLGGWPTAMAGPRGLIVALPLGVSYRFH